MHPFIGVLFHAVAGLAAASFYIPFKRVKGWAWETYWLTQGFAAWIIMPIVIAWLTTHFVTFFTSCTIHIGTVGNETAAWQSGRSEILMAMQTGRVEGELQSVFIGILFPIKGIRIKGKIVDHITSSSNGLCG